MSEEGYNDEEFAIMTKQYRKIEECLGVIIRIQKRSGLLTDWIILSTVQDFDDEGVAVTNTGWHTNPDNSIPYHRMLGLLRYGMVMMERECV